MKADSLKVPIESRLVIKINEVIGENIKLKEDLEWHSFDDAPKEDGYYICTNDFIEFDVEKYENGRWYYWSEGGEMYRAYEYDWALPKFYARMAPIPSKKEIGKLLKRP